MIRPTFQLKHFEQIAASMMNLMASVQSAITDYNIGSVNRTLLESVAMELEELYYRTFQGIEDGIPAGVYEAFGFAQLPASPGVGLVSFSRSTPGLVDYTIPAGTIVSTSTGLNFATIADVVLPAGSLTVTAQISALIAGSSGNAAAGSITLMSTAVLGIESVTNAIATAGGADQETPGQQQARFAEFIVSLARSPLNGIEAGAKTVTLIDPSSGVILERVMLAKAVEYYLIDPSAPIGIVTLYIDNGSGGASAALVAKTQQVIDGYVNEDGIAVMGYRAAGIVVDVVAVSMTTIAVTASVVLDAGASQTAVDAALRNAIANVFASIDISTDLNWPTLLSAMMVVSGVNTVVLTDPPSNVSGTVGARMRPGVITLTYT